MKTLPRIVYLSLVFLAASILNVGLFDQATAQIWPLTGGRALSRDGRWMAPVSSFTLSSDENDHQRRGSVNAWDISAPYGSSIYPMGPGQVVYAGCNNAGGYGCWALIDHKNGYTSLYAHLIDEGDGKIWVERGDIIGTWTPIGRLGWTGTTSFGPHVHWEIRQSGKGRIRLDELFPRFQMEYCKFCEAKASAGGRSLGGLRDAASQQALTGLTAAATSRYLLLLLAALLLAASLARPAIPLRFAKGAGTLMLRSGRASKMQVKRFRESSGWAYANVVLIILIPAMLCGSTSAVAVWMTDEGISGREIWRNLRFGLSPLVGPGYETGLRYSAVWGTPCSQVGTLGRTCDVDEIVDKGLDWREEIFEYTGSRPVFAVIPRISTLFGYSQIRQLIRQAHESGGLVIVDIEADMEMAEEVIRRLVPFGLDGIAIDIEYADVVTTEEIERLGILLARERKAVGLRTDGVLVVWDVFHNVRMNTSLEVNGVEIVPIFTGYGSAESKLAGLAVTQKLFARSAAESGIMAFDNRWPINRSCVNLSKESGFDCQDWRELFSIAEARAVGWWVQQ